MIFTIENHDDENGGALTDAASATIGIIRTDTDAEVVANGTAMTHVSEGVYSYELEDPVAGVTYRATWVLTDTDDSVTTDSYDVTAAGVTPTCIYITSYAKFVRKWGLKNLIEVTNKDNAVSPTDADTDQIQDAFDFAVYEINKQMQGGIYTVPLTPSGADIDLSVENWLFTIAYSYLYYGRFDDAPDNVDGMVQANSTAKRVRTLNQQVYADMSLARNGHIRLTCRAASRGSMRPRMITNTDINASPVWALQNSYRQCVPEFG